MWKCNRESQKEPSQNTEKPHKFSANLLSRLKGNSFHNSAFGKELKTVRTESISRRAKPNEEPSPSHFHAAKHIFYVQDCILLAVGTGDQNANAYSYVLLSIWLQVAEVEGSFARNEFKRRKAKRKAHVQSKNPRLNLESLVKSGVLNARKQERSEDYLNPVLRFTNSFSSPPPTPPLIYIYMYPTLQIFQTAVILGGPKSPKIGKDLKVE